MAKAFRLTQNQFDSLPNTVKAKFGSRNISAKWYHSNYHLCSIIAAIDKGIKIPAHVYASYDTWTQRNVFDRRIAKRKIDFLLSLV